MWAAHLLDDVVWRVYGLVAHHLRVRGWLSRKKLSYESENGITLGRLTREASGDHLERRLCIVIERGRGLHRPHLQIGATSRRRSTYGFVRTSDLLGHLHREARSERERWKRSDSGEEMADVRLHHEKWRRRKSSSAETSADRDRHGKWMRKSRSETQCAPLLHASSFAAVRGRRLISTFEIEVLRHLVSARNLEELWWGKIMKSGLSGDVARHLRHHLHHLHLRRSSESKSSSADVSGHQALSLSVNRHPNLLHLLHRNPSIDRQSFRKL
jgi:hypothetical protein